MTTPNDDDSPVAADEALARLMEGNVRFLRGEPRHSHTPREVLADLAKQAFLLGARHYDFSAAFDRPLGVTGLAPTQGGMKLKLFTQRRAQALRLEGHRLGAIADQCRHV